WPGAARAAPERPVATSAEWASVTTAWPPSTAGRLSGPVWWRWPTGWRCRPGRPRTRRGSLRPDRGMLLMAEPMTAGTAPIGAVVIDAGPARLAAAAARGRACAHMCLVGGSARFGGEY